MQNRLCFWMVLTAFTGHAFAGGVLQIGNGAEPEGLDPHLTTGVVEYNIISSLLEGLITEDPRTLEPLPGVAERWEVSADGLVYTFHFRKNAKWTNGDRVTPQDFVYSFQRMLHPELGAEYAYMLYVMKNAEAWHNGTLDDPAKLGVQATGDHTLAITLEKPAPYFLKMLNHHSWYPVHPPTIEKHGGAGKRNNPWARPEFYVSNGPFTLKEWKMNQRINVEKNPGYWDAANVKADGLVFHAIEDVNTEERMFRKGELHLTKEVPVSKVPLYIKKKDPKFSSAPYLTTYYYLINTTRKPFNDVRVRKALSLATQRTLLTDRVLRGGQKPAKWFTPEGVSGFEPKVRVQEDLKQARKLLAEAGYPGGKGFPKFTLLYNTQDMHKRVAEVMQQMWKQALGIECQLLNQEWQVYMKNRRELNFDVSRAGWAGDYADPHNFLDLHLGASGNNNTGWSNAEYDALINEAAGTSNTEKRFALYERAEQILLDEMPIIPIYWYTRNILKQPSVKGWYPNVLDRQNWRWLSLEGE